MYTVRRSVPLAALLLLILSLAVVAPVAAQAPTVSGNVTYMLRIALPEDAVVNVQIQDISRPDAPAEVIGEQTIQTNGAQVPIPYAVEYDPAKIVESNTYAVRATIKQGDTLLWTSDTVIPVITKGAPTENVEIMVVQVAAPAEAQPAQPPREPEATAEPAAPATLPTTGGAPILPLALVIFFGAATLTALTIHRVATVKQ